MGDPSASGEAAGVRRRSAAQRRQPAWLRELSSTGDSGVAQALLDFDRGTTPLGPPAGWPVELRAVVRTMLSSRFAMWMGWGPDLTFFYNDAYARATLGSKHPWALGRPARDVWAEIWPDIEPRIQTVLDNRGATWDERLLLFLERNGYREETYHTFSYSPVHGPGGVTGMLCVVSEETERVIGERRMTTLRTLAAGLASARTEPEVLEVLPERLMENRFDLPFSLVYLFEAPGRARLACAVGIERGHRAAPELITAADAETSWPISVRSDQVVVESLSQRFGELPTGEWEDPPRNALVAALGPQGDDQQPAGLLIAGLSPYRPLDATYTGFVGLLAGQVSAAIASTRAYGQAVRREAADALRSERHQLEQTLEQLPVGVLLAEAPSGRIVLANERVGEILGRPLTEGSDLEKFGSYQRLTLDGEPLPIDRWPLARAIRDGEVIQDLDMIYRAPRGHDVIVRVNSAPIRDQHGHTFAGVVVLQDMSSQVRSQRLLSTHRDILARIAQGEPLDGTLQLIVQSIEALIESDARASILLRSDDGLRLELGAAPSLPSAYNDAIDGVEIGEGLASCGTAAYRGTPVIVTDIAFDPLWTDFRDLASAHGLRACWSTPIDATDGEVVGTFAIYYDQPRGPTDDDQQLLALMTETAAVAIERDRAARARERRFNEMQSSLLPRALASVPGIEVAARLHPGTRGLEVGGDFYDIFPLDENAWGFVIGDVCGHGAEAAAATAIARHTTRAVALRESESGKVLVAVHEALCRSDLDRFCTAIYGRLELTGAGARLRFSNGGHPAPLLLRSDGTIEHLRDHGPLLGVLSSGHVYPTVEVELGAGDALMMYTDGLTERNPRLPTEESLRSLLASVVGLPAEEAIQRLETTSIATDPSPARDDIALLLLRVAPPPSRSSRAARDPHQASLGV